MKRAKIISIKIESGDAGLYHATSPDMRELFVSGETVQEVLDAIPSVIKAIYHAHGISAEAIPAEESDIVPSPWVILSAEQNQLAC